MHEATSEICGTGNGTGLHGCKWFWEAMYDLRNN